MLGYFRINDPYRLIIIFILLLLFRLPFLISPEWDTIPELRWMIIGERTNEGALLYVDVWDDIGPLSALTYRVIDFIFGRSQLVLQLAGLIVFCFHVFYINMLALKHKLFNENNYLPALFYGILGLTFFNIITLSPQLLGMVFVLLSLNSLFNHVETRNRTDGNLLNIGIYTGIASLFYLPFLIMLVTHIAGLIFFTNTIRRRYMLLLYGAAIPSIVCWLIYAWLGYKDALLTNFYGSLLTFDSFQFLDTSTIAFALGLSAFLYIISTFKILFGFGFTVFQVRSQKVMFIASLVALLIYLLYADQDGYSFVLFFPWVAFFLSHFFLSIRKAANREVTFFLYLTSIIALYMSMALNLFAIRDHLQLDSLLIKPPSGQAAYAQKKTLVIGPDIRPYFSAKQATPYFNWNLSKKQLEELNYYDNVQAIDKNFRNDMPEFIIDQEGLVPDLFEKLPLIGVEYEQTEKDLYQRKFPNN